jgi:hypothetical protein
LGWGGFLVVEARISRLAKNEALFRELNERVAEITQEFTAVSPEPDVVDGLVCECSDPLSLERGGPLTIPEYARVRRDARRFIIAAGHQAPDVERVVEKQKTYWLVEKNEGVPSDVARELDPRS